MAYYVAPFNFVFTASQIVVDAGQADVSVIDLYTAIKEARASQEGILYDAIAQGSGRVSLGGGTQVGLTVNLVGSWQLKFAEGNYIARVSEGNLVGGPSGDPIAYSAGVQTLLIQSAAATVVSVSGSGGTAPTAAQNAAAVWAASSRSLTVDPGADAHAATQAAVGEIAKIHGLDPAAPLVVEPTSRKAGSIEQSVNVSGDVVTVTRTA